MNGLTAGEIWARREALEANAATLLGRMLFEFSRLDMNLGLCLAWVDDGANIPQRTKLVERMKLKDKLDELVGQVQAKLPSGSKRRKAYEAWIEEAHALRMQRNLLVHGRWGVEAHKDKVVNVSGLPTSDRQQVTEYSLAELAAINDNLSRLQTELTRLRTQWPL